ncbi:MAG: hypothetical protein M3Z10_02340 [Gemmatimonadota bacterium]|nr:hypothetical protein [Gemmatimonadota bacterium]
MLTTRWHAVALTILCDLLATPAAGQSTPSSALLGHWEGTRASSSGMGNTLNFATGNQLEFAYVVTLNGAYRTEGDRLIRAQLAPPGSTTDNSQDTAYFAVRGDSLFRWWRSRPDTVAAARTSASRSRAGLAGQWSYPYARLVGQQAAARLPNLANAIAVETYADSGRFHFRVPLRPESMKYRVHADTVFLEGAPLPGGHARW